MYSTDPHYNVLQELWARQQISNVDVDYSLWKKEKQRLQQLAGLSGSCLFAVDVYKETYDYASEGFCELFGYDRTKLRTISRQGDYLESRFHIDDYEKLLELRIGLSNFIYSLPPQNRNDYRNIYEFRVKNNLGQYVNVISRQQVLLEDRKGKAWIIMGMMDLSADQTPLENPRCSVVNRRTGDIFDANSLVASPDLLTTREKEILLLIGQGLLSKEIATALDISIHTVNNHRKNILGKLGADNAMEAVTRARKLGEI